MIIKNLIETHCHILPEIDDGASSLEMSLEMVERLKGQGAEKIIVTPHYYSDSISLADFVKKRNAAYERLCRALPSDSPEIIPAAEVYISKYLFGNDDLSEICAGDTKYAFIEHPFSEDFSDRALERLSSLIIDYGITPVLVHIERYRSLMDDTDTLDELIDLGCLTQVNISSFADAHRSIRKKLFKYLESGRISFIGSDCHNLTTRCPNLGQARQQARAFGAESEFNELRRNAVKLLFPRGNQ